MKTPFKRITRRSRGLRVHACTVHLYAIYLCIAAPANSAIAAGRASERARPSRATGPVEHSPDAFADRVSAAAGKMPRSNTDSLCRSARKTRIVTQQAMMSTPTAILGQLSVLRGLCGICKREPHTPKSERARTHAHTHSLSLSLLSINTLTANSVVSCKPGGSNLGHAPA